MPQHTFTIGETDFLLDGNEFRILSGALHYFRIHPDQWRDRIHLGKAMGLNTIETYVPWNLHELRPGRLDFTGGLDLERFLDLIAAEDLHAIVRPGPYICAELDGGGLPAWLFDDTTIRLRSSDPRFLASFDPYLHAVLDRMVDRQIDRGGPVILLQVENEFGAYGDDPTYLQALTDRFRRAGITVPLTTVDQPTPQMLRDGTLPELLTTGSFGSRATERLRTLRQAQPTGPLMCSEFWCGWFDHWGAHHHTTDAAQSAAELDDLLSAGASVNIYMLHGGTNFGLTSGANDKGTYQPTVTSYDYDAPLDEAGRPTEKFWRFREVIGRHAALPPLPHGLPTDPAAPRQPFRTPEPVPLSPVRSLDSALAEVPFTAVDELPTRDALGIHRGLLRYRITLDGDDRPAVLRLSEVRDRAWLRLDGIPVGTLAREDHESALWLPRSRGVLDILVEDCGRLNYGPRLGEPKGLIGPAQLHRGPEVRELTDWQVGEVPLERIVEATPDGAAGGPGAWIHRAEIPLDRPTDLALLTDGLGKGLAWWNGFPLGRYWRKGPQTTLFVPAPVTCAGTNELTLLELEVLTTEQVRFAPDLRLGPTEE